MYVCKLYSLKALFTSLFFSCKTFKTTMALILIHVFLHVNKQYLKYLILFCYSKNSRFSA